tara:strand:+ start:612 stop:2216 length:1605 start_codon:yes stop_codon:yes gene_type:complete
MSYKKIDLERLIFVLTTEFNLNNDDLVDYEIIRALRLMCCDYLAQSLDFIKKQEFNKDFDSILKKRITVSPPIYNDNDLLNLVEIINFLDSLPLPDQRTPEWYSFRNNRLTASDLATAIGLRGQGSRETLILKKCGHQKPFRANAAIKHGVRYEDVAVQIYEIRNDVKVKEYGCVPHPTIKIFGASPDGICSYESNNKNYIGRMLEIKCPYSRQITGIIPKYYFYQVLGQLEVCDLEYCDFLECSIKEYNNSEEYWNDIYQEVDQFENTITNNSPTVGQYGLSSLGNEKGILIEYLNREKEKSLCFYAPIGISPDDFDKWFDDNMNTIENDDNLIFSRVFYWKLIEMNTVLVKRDKFKWARTVPLICEFWDEVEKTKALGSNGISQRIKKSTQNKRKKRTKTQNTIMDLDAIDTSNSNDITVKIEKKSSYKKYQRPTYDFSDDDFKINTTNTTNTSVNRPSKRKNKVAMKKKVKKRVKKIVKKRIKKVVKKNVNNYRTASNELELDCENEIEHLPDSGGSDIEHPTINYSDYTF